MSDIVERLDWLASDEADDIHKLAKAEITRLRADKAALVDVLRVAHSFLDGWHMVDDEAQKEADSLASDILAILQAKAGEP